MHMQNFLIRELRITGPEKEDAFITFSDGFNLISGWSQTGKTWILKSIYYLFGSSGRPFNSRTGYKTIIGTFETEAYGTVLITRNIDENKAIVACDNEAVSGVYETTFKRKKNVFGYLDNFWLSVIGAESDLMIPDTKLYKRKHLSWTNIASIFFLDENEIDSNKSIILKRNKNETYDVATLLYLLNGDYKKNCERIPTIDEKNHAKKTMAEYFDEEETSLFNELSDYKERLSSIKQTDASESAKELSHEAELVQQHMDMLMDERKTIAEELPALRKDEINLEVEIDRDERLISEYKADLQRMGFIFDGEKAIASVPNNPTCPFCGSDIKEIPKSFKDGIVQETKRIVAELNVIIQAQENSKLRKSEAMQRTRVLKERDAEIQSDLDQLVIDLSDFNSSLSSFSEHTRIKSRISYIEEELDRLAEKRKSMNKKKKDTQKQFNAKDEFKDQIGSGFDDILNDLFVESGFLDGDPSWDFKKFDIRIDDIPKKDDQGKGRCSFLNSLVGLMLFEYFNSENALYHPGFLIIDTPLLGFDENPEGDDRYIREGLYKCFMNHADKGQIIAVDNVKVLPKIDFEDEGVPVTTYNKAKFEGGTYGFIPNFTKDIAKVEKKKKGQKK